MDVAWARDTTRQTNDFHGTREKNDKQKFLITQACFPGVDDQSGRRGGFTAASSSGGEPSTLSCSDGLGLT
jgi:hypothetical protein